MTNSNNETMNKIGFGYKQNLITKETLTKKYGDFWFKCVDDNHSEGWINTINQYNQTMYIEEFDNIPMGLEKKISLHWFSHFFNWKKMDTYQVSVDGNSSFHGNWLDVPFPNSTHIKHCLDFDDRDITTLKDTSYNWYELFIMMDELMWKSGRVLDIGITDVSVENLNINNKVITIGVSS